MPIMLDTQLVLGSDWLDGDAGRMGGESPQVAEVARQDCAAGFGSRHDQRIYC
jgi:hypothetical protein